MDTLPLQGGQHEENDAITTEQMDPPPWLANVRDPDERASLKARYDRNKREERLEWEQRSREAEIAALLPIRLPRREPVLLPSASVLRQRILTEKHEVLQRTPAHARERMIELFIADLMRTIRGES